MHSGTWHLFMRGAMIGGLSSLVIFTILFTLSLYYGWFGLTLIDLDFISQVSSWLYTNLRFSIIPFAIVLICYIVCLRRMDVLLKSPDHSQHAKISQTEHWLDILSGLFFGVGVIWTAIGMRSALLAGLGDLDAETAAQLGAFAILQRLVDGGILLALSTTIVGGVGGYLMRVIKSLLYGRKLQLYYQTLMREETQPVLDMLQRIEQQLIVIRSRTVIESDKEYRGG